MGAKILSDLQEKWYERAQQHATRHATEWREEEFRRCMAAMAVVHLLSDALDILRERRIKNRRIAYGLSKLGCCNNPACSVYGEEMPWMLGPGEACPMCGQVLGEF